MTQRNYDRRFRSADAEVFRWFDGRKYYQVATMLGKGSAQWEADEWRDAGYLARVTYTKTWGWEVWAARP